MLCADLAGCELVIGFFVEVYGINALFLKRLTADCSDVYCMDLGGEYVDRSPLQSTLEPLKEANEM